MKKGVMIILGLLLVSLYIKYDALVDLIDGIKGQGAVAESMKEVLPNIDTDSIEHIKEWVTQKPKDAEEKEDEMTVTTESQPVQMTVSEDGASFSIDEIEPYTGAPACIVNDNVPYFTADEITDVGFEQYSEMDTLNRCGPAVASVGREMMPTEKRGDIGMVKPSGWHTVKYPDQIKDLYLYNRCHLIAYMLTGENANEKNLVTGTRYMNVDGMLPYESAVSDYVYQTNNHVMYRVTPVFVGNELVCRGVLMEALSVEDGGSGLSFCVFAYNVQPQIGIDYATGDSWVL